MQWETVKRRGNKQHKTNAQQRPEQFITRLFKEQGLQRAATAKGPGQQQRQPPPRSNPVTVCSQCKLQHSNPDLDKCRRACCKGELTPYSVNNKGIPFVKVQPAQTKKTAAAPALPAAAPEPTSTSQDKDQPQGTVNAKECSQRKVKTNNS